MSQTAPGFEVTMHLWVEDAVSSRTHLDPEVRTYFVQPPTWCHDDPVQLEMHLDHLTKLQFLYEIRRRARAKEKAYAHLHERNNIVVRGLMAQYLYPADANGVRREVKFHFTRLRAA